MAHIAIKMVLICLCRFSISFSDYDKIRNYVTFEWIFQMSDAMKISSAVSLMSVLRVSTRTDGQIAKTRYAKLFSL